jgi:hypothetical protein
VVLITAGAPGNLRKTCSLENPAPGGTPGLKSTRVGAILKKVFFYENDLKIKKNLIRKVLNFVSIQ